MCVILYCDKGRPSKEMVAGAWEANRYGGGVAWREKQGGEMVVAWEKGLDEKEMREKCASLPLPFVAHFRIPAGAGAGIHLTHPFPLSDKVELDYEGTSAKGVLFHNGVWAGWRQHLWDVMIRSRSFELPTGEWSDSRAMALIAHHFGLGMLEIIGEKAVVFMPNDVEFFGSGWSREEGGHVLTSNSSWRRGTFRPGSSSCALPGPATGRSGSVASSDEHKGSHVGATGGGSTSPLPQSGRSSIEGSQDSSRVAATLPLSKKAAKRLRKREEKLQRKELRRLEKNLQAQNQVVLH